MTGEKITTYKGFDINFQCRGLQYEVGETYTHSGGVEICESGFHGCEYPLDIFSYYPPGTSRFAVVEQSGSIKRHDTDSKVASRCITVQAELTLSDLIKAAVEFTLARCTSADPSSPASSTGIRGAASSTGIRGAASSTGDYGAASSTGYQGAASSTGYQGAASSTGKYSVAMACGPDGRAMAGESGAIVLCHRGDNGEILHIRASKVGENGVRAGVWYMLDKDGRFVEAI